MKGKTLIKVIVALILLFILNTISYASDIDDVIVPLEVTDEYKKWEELSEEEKENTIMPRIYDVDNSYTENTRLKTRPLMSSLYYSKLKLSNYSQYDLRDNINVRVNNQMQTNMCWALAINSVLESNVEKITGENSPNYSGRYLEYVTSKNFKDGVNSLAYNRNIGSGGTKEMALGAYTRGLGPVLEEEFPFENNENEIYLSAIQGFEPKKQIKDYVWFASIYKYYPTSGTVYTNSSGRTYSDSELTQIRDSIKEHIIRYGALVSETYISGYGKYYFDDISNTHNAKAYFCNRANVEADHQVTIIGWDDNYSVDNFNVNCRPSSPGAYIVLNSWGEDFATNGVYYISYEDKFIERDLLGIVSTSDIEYDNIYQYDEYGNNSVITSTSDIYLASVYTRKSLEDTELLNQISVSSFIDMKCDIYVNAIDGELNINKCIKVAENYFLKNGYHTIDLDTPIKLQGEKFVVIIKSLLDDSNRAYIPLETKDDSFWNNASGGTNRCFLSTNATTWSDINSVRTMPANSDICMKAFTIIDSNPVTEEPGIDNPGTEEPGTDNPGTEEPGIDNPGTEEPEIDNPGTDNPGNNNETNNTVTSKVYKIENNYIYKISPNTLLSDFYRNLEYEGTCYISNNENVYTDIVKTGSKLHIGDNEYTLIVKADLNGDGKLTISDGIKARLQIAQIREISDVFKKALDLNFDGNLSLVDLIIINLAGVRIIEL